MNEQYRKLYKVDIGVYHRIASYPLGAFMILVVVSVLSIMIAISAASFIPVILSVILWGFGGFLNKKLDGNFFYTKKMNHHDHISTRNFIILINRLKNENSAK